MQQYTIREHMLSRLPSVRELTRWLRILNDALKHPDAGGEFYGLICDHGSWALNCEWGREYGWTIYGREYVPGSEPFDAVASAKRLLAAVRDGVE